MSALAEIPTGTLARAIQVFDNELEGVARARLISVIAANPDWHDTNRELGTKIWARARLSMHGIRSAVMLEHWWLALEMALGCRETPDLRK